MHYTFSRHTAGRQRATGAGSRHFVAPASRVGRARHGPGRRRVKPQAAALDFDQEQGFTTADKLPADEFTNRWRDCIQAAHVGQHGGRHECAAPQPGGDFDGPYGQRVGCSGSPAGPRQDQVHDRIAVRLLAGLTLPRPAH